MNEKIFEEITQQVIAKLSQGIIPWTKPWVCSGGIISHVTGKPYSLLNSLLLERSGEYMTFLQIQQEGGWLHKGTHSKRIYFWKTLKRQEISHDEHGNEIIKEKIIPYLKAYNVFHISDVDGIKPRFGGTASFFNNKPEERGEQVAADYLSREHIILKHDSVDEAYYSPSRDLVQVPPLNQHKSSAEYYSTLYHELVHSTGNTKRLDRFSSSDPKATAYAKEELVAELGAAMVLSELGIKNDKTFCNSVAYCQSWIRNLQNDPKMIVYASSKAEKAVKYILGEQITNAA